MSPGMSMPGTPASTGSTSSGSAASGAHNHADVAFATKMIPHHGQALQMARIALSKTANAQVRRLANAISQAQTPEISLMSSWLKAWKQPVPDPSMGGMNMGGMSMPGMMSSAQMAKLTAASGTAFDKLWLTLMIKHHQGALAMANTELRAGQSTEAKSLARSIIAGQSAEISTMTRLLPTIG